MNMRFQKCYASQLAEGDEMINSVWKRIRCVRVQTIVPCQLLGSQSIMKISFVLRMRKHAYRVMCM
jgi:hypothetical protein